MSDWLRVRVWVRILNSVASRLENKSLFDVNHLIFFQQSQFDFDLVDWFKLIEIEISISIILLISPDFSVLFLLLAPLGRPRGVPPPCRAPPQDHTKYLDRRLASPVSGTLGIWYLLNYY